MAPSADRPAAGPAAGPAPTRDFDEDVEDADEEPVAPRGPRTTPFGSVWDSQLGTSAAPAAANLTPLSDDDEDFDEPEIPEYLIAEQRRGARPGGARGGQGGGGRGGPRGGRAAYQSAVERERYGGGRGGGGINRYPDVSGRTGGNAGNGAPARPPREDRGFGRRDERPREAAPRPSSSSEPWSEVPPELEAMLRAQVGQKPSPATDRSAPMEATAPEAVIVETELEGTEAAEATAPKRRTTTRKASASKASTDGESAEATPKRRSTRKPAATADTASTDGASAGTETEAGAAEASAPKRRTARKSTAASGDTGSASDAGSETAAPKRRTTRKSATSSTESA